MLSLIGPKPYDSASSFNRIKATYNNGKETQLQALNNVSNSATNNKNQCEQNTSLVEDEM